MTVRRLSAATIAITVCLFANASNAATITLADYNGPNAEITCTPSCEAFVGSNPGLIQLSQTIGDNYPKAGNPAGELARLNELLVQFSPARSAVSYVDKTDIEQGSWSTDRQYFSIKQSINLWFFENMSGGTVTVTARGDDWSHTTAYGPATVPVPAAAWLFGSALLGLVGLARRKSV